MSKNEFIKRVNKQLWFLNAKEKNALNKYIDSVDQNKSIDTNKPIRFSNEYLKKFIFNHKKKIDFSCVRTFNLYGFSLCIFARTLYFRVSGQLSYRACLYQPKY